MCCFPTLGGARARLVVFLHHGSLCCSEEMFIGECELFKTCRVYEAALDAFLSLE